jgi:hypothetical protein
MRILPSFRRSFVILVAICHQVLLVNSFVTTSITTPHQTLLTSTTTDVTADTTAATTAVTKSRVQRIIESTDSEIQAGGAGASTTYQAFLRAEENWTRLKQSKPVASSSIPSTATPPFTFITSDGAMGSTKCWNKLRQVQENKASLDYDVVVCGGTLGIFFATALALRGGPETRICVLEAGKLQGRVQEWNISRKELEEMIGLGILTAEEVEEVIQTEFPGCRSGFKNKEVTPTVGGYFDNGVGYETVTPDVLNLGVAPSILLERVKDRFLSLGGTIREDTRLQGICVSDSVGTALDLGSSNDDKDNEPITSRLVLDCMGNASPISRQQRYGMKPDGVCAVVGSCASGFRKDTNLIGDIIYTNSEIKDKGEHGQYQYFWEAFPVGVGKKLKPGESDTKTTYMFTYMDADEKRVTLESLMEDYLDQLPVYQPDIQDPEKDLDFKRVLFAFFPTYRDSPLQPNWSRVLAVGDASGIQSPLSFGGFGALTRHLDRIAGALDDALKDDLLSKEDLGKINAYTPNLSATWMFQRSMSVRMGQKVDPKFVNRLLATNFEQMDQAGLRTIKPFLQDVVRFDGLVSSLAGSFVADPTFMPQIIAHVGLPALVDWLGHVSMMGLYTVLDAAVSPVAEPIVDIIKNPRQRFHWKRQMEAWKYGSGRDYVLPTEAEEKEAMVSMTSSAT